MHEQQKILGLAPVQKRLAGIHQAQQRQKMVKKLREWRFFELQTLQPAQDAIGY